MDYKKYIIVLMLTNLLAMGILGQCGNQPTDGQQATASVSTEATSVTKSTNATPNGSPDASGSETGDVDEIPENKIEF